MNILTKLAFSNNQKNKTRSILVMLSVFLTTVLLAAIATFGYGQIKYQKANAKEFYGSYYGTYVGVDETEIAEMEKRSEFDHIGRAATAGSIEDSRTISMVWMDQETIRLTNLKRQLEKGSFPDQQNEIAGQKALFERIGYPDAKVGDTVTVHFRRNNNETYRTQRFVISGLLKNTMQEQENQSYTAYVSKQCYELLYPQQERRYSIYFTLANTVQVNSSTLEETIKDLAQKCGINPEYASENTYYALWVLDPGMELIVGCIVVALIVVLFAVVVIYNIFQVGVIWQIQEYGKIRALGTTTKQLKKMIFREGMMLAVPGVPAGLAVGTVISIFYTRFLLSENEFFEGKDVVQVSIISVPLLIFCGAAAFLTVWMALKRPMKMVASISPIEAIRFQGRQKKRQGFRKGKKQIGVSQLTRANMCMNGKRTVMTIIFMGFSCVLFIVIANFTGNISTKYEARKQIPYGQFQIDLTYSTNDSAYPENNLNQILQSDPLDEELVEKIQTLDEVEDVKIRYMMYAYDQEGTMQSIGILTKKQFEKEASQGALKGTVDYDLASKNGDILYGWSHFVEDSGYDFGDTITMKMGNESGEITFQGKMAGAFGSTNYDWIITDQTFRKMGLPEQSISTIWVDCSPKNCDKVRGELEELLKDKEHYEFSSYEGILQSSKSSLGVMESLAYSLLFLIGMISFMNMANTMIISIITRKRELGVLQAIGMTNVQLNRMLRNEGILFTSGSVLVALLVGMPAGYALFRYGRANGYFGLDVYHIPVVEIVAMIAILAVLQISLSFLLSRNIKKESLVERIRYQE